MLETDSHKGRGARIVPDGYHVTAVVPTFNRARYIVESIESLLNQTVPLHRIIVVDDGSTDDTARRLAGLSGEIVYVYQPNRGKAAALNKAMNMIADGLVWVFDDDDIAMGNALESMLQGFASDPSAGFAYGSHEIFGTDGKGVDYRYPAETPMATPETLFGVLLEGMFINQGEMLVRRSCYEEVGPFDVNLVRSQDYDMILRLSRSFRGIAVPATVYSQRQHAGIRGTREKPVQAAEMGNAWLAYDQIIIRKLYNQSSFNELMPSVGSDLLRPAKRLTFHFKKFVVFCRAGLQDLALAELSACAKLANEADLVIIDASDAALLRRALDERSRGLESFLEERGTARAFDDFASPRVKASIRHALASPLPFALRNAIRHRSASKLRLNFEALRRLRGTVFAVTALMRVCVAIIAGKIAGRGDYEAAKLKAAA